MKATGEIFAINRHDESIMVEVFKPKAKGGDMYLVKLTSEAPLFVTRTHNDDEEFWTSVPEGRLKLAGELGKLIDLHYLPKQKMLF